MNAFQSKFIELLRELFQFDRADLDFGIYRIMNYKRDVIEEFITKDLPKAIADELDRGELAEQSQAAKELKEVSDQIVQAFGKDTLNYDGNLAEAYHNTPLGKKYLDLKVKASGGRARGALEGEIYNHLFAFFSRYYQDGDFISKRRYSKRQKYAIPYNGEEVYLYWANHDQYYIKTAEHFHDYSYNAPNGVTVHFKLTAVDVEQNNVKGDKRFFLPRVKEIAWDEKEGNLIIPFEYRPLTEQEAITFGKRSQQQAIIDEAVTEIPQRLNRLHQALLALTAERRKTADGGSVSYLEQHLRQYTRRNTSDFFIHKDLKGFLTRELDFYLKNEVLNLEEMEAAGEEHAEGWFQIMRVIKAIGGCIIDFLDQIENFQKILWEKRKFITETQYCITLGNIDKSFYPDIVSTEPQWDEWKELFHIDEEETNLFNSGKDKKGKSIAFLEDHPTLILDTKHFDQSFVDRLLGSFDDLDVKTDGLLVHSENWQALKLLLEMYRQSVQLIHIDPPYNTQTSGFLYKNDYQHSSWLAMMQDRIELGFSYLKERSVFSCHIDECEMEHLHVLLEQNQLMNAGTLVWDKGMPIAGANGLATQHEYVLFRTRGNVSIRVKKKNIELIQGKIRKVLNGFGAPTKEAISEYRKWLRSQRSFTKSEMTYDQFDETGKAFRSDNMSATDRRAHEKFYVPLRHPRTGQICPVPAFGWRYTPDSMGKLQEEGLILFGEDHTNVPRKITYIENTPDSQMSTVFRSGSRGKTFLDNLGLEFPFAHPIGFYSYMIDASSGINDYILDYFAGSGTTGHAVIYLNREDGGHRKFILAEISGYFDTVLLPRIKKVTFSPEWKDGKPKRMATQEEAERSPCIVKYIRLESYEDTLNNIEFDDASGQQALQFEDYLLKYMLKWETRASETLLNVEELARPFSYKLHIHADGQTREKVADIPETFNYLLGLHVQTRRVHDDDRRRYLVYRGRIDHRQIAVIWRETEGWLKADYERDKKFVAEQKLAEGVDEIFINGDSFIKDAKAIEPVFKARMFASVRA